MIEKISQAQMSRLDGKSLEQTGFTLCGGRILSMVDGNEVVHIVLRPDSTYDYEVFPIPQRKAKK